MNDQMPTNPASDLATQDFKLDSSYFVAFSMAHDALKQGLSKASPLNVTQYRVLATLLGAFDGNVAQAQLADACDMKANVLSSVMDALESRGFAQRSPGKADARTRTVRITPQGEAHVASVNQAIIDALYRIFPSQSRNHRQILEAAIIAGAHISPVLATQPRYPASRALIALEVLSQTMEQRLKILVNANLNECRIVQCLSERTTPLRIRDLAEILHMSTVNVARCGDRLAKRSWVRKVSSETDKKAVYLELTVEGSYQAEVICSCIDQLATTKLWAGLTPQERLTISQVGHVVLAQTGHH